MTKFNFVNASKGLGIFPWEDAEATVHELAHAFDCIGPLAFDNVGNQNRVNRLIENKYGTSFCDRANRAEIQVAAVTYTTLQLLEEEFTKETIIEAAWDNLRGDWKIRYTREDIAEMFEKALETQVVKDTALGLSEFLLRNYPVEV